MDGLRDTGTSCSCTLKGASWLKGFDGSCQQEGERFAPLRLKNASAIPFAHVERTHIVFTTFHLGFYWIFTRTFDCVEATAVRALLHLAPWKFQTVFPARPQLRLAFTTGHCQVVLPFVRKECSLSQVELYSGYRRIFFARRIPILLELE